MRGTRGGVRCARGLTVKESRAGSELIYSPLASRLSHLSLLLLLIAAFPTFSTESIGERIYTRGLGAAPISASLAASGLELPAERVPCAGCHGERGQGGNEGGVRVPAIDPVSLAAGGRPHYDDTALARAILQGEDPTGRPLHPAMPRYRLGPEDLRALVDYLRGLDDRPIPGVTPNGIRVGTIQPASGPLSAAGTEVLALLRSHFQEVNRRGGIYGRQVHIEPIFYTPGEPAPASDGVFCLVASLTPNAAPGSNLPSLGPLTLLPAPEQAAPQTFYLQASLRDQGEILAQDAAAEGTGGRRGLVYAREPLAEAAAEGIRSAVALRLTQTFAPGSLEAKPLLVALEAAGVDELFFLGPGAQLATVRAEAAARRWPGRIRTLALLSGPPPPGNPPVHTAAPWPPPDAPEALERLIALGTADGSPPRHTVLLLGAYAGARLLQEGLERAGRTLTRDRLVAALNGITGFDTGAIPPLTFGHDRPTGLTGAALFDAEGQAVAWRERQ